MPYPTCFVLMPFGQKADAQGNMIDFDKAYRELIHPAVTAAELDPIRADEELLGGIIHKPMFERLILCPFAVADLTLANANVFYELGVRHAVRPASTISIFAEGTRLPFDVAMVRAMPYGWLQDGALKDLAVVRDSLTKMLRAAKKDRADDSPVFQLMDLPWRGKLDDLAHQKTDTFREQFHYSEERKQQLAAARKAGVDAIRKVEQEIKATAGKLENEEVGVVVDLYLSYRAVKAWSEMVRLVKEMSRPVAETVMVQEQLALALNREAGERLRSKDVVNCHIFRDQAIKVLTSLIEHRGASSETNGILGRIYKDCWEEARNSNNVAAPGWLRKAIESYLQGFEADWRDAYPGINAVTLMELQEPPDERRMQLVPVVSYSVERKIASKKPDYWDYATRLELAVLAKDQGRAEAALADALTNQREVWEAETTARNLRLIREAREHRGEPVVWLLAIEQQLVAAGRVSSS